MHLTAKEMGCALAQSSDVWDFVGCLEFCVYKPRTRVRARCKFFLQNFDDILHSKELQDPFVPVPSWDSYHSFQMILVPVRKVLLGDSEQQGLARNTTTWKAVCFVEGIASPGLGVQILTFPTHTTVLFCLPH